MNAAEDDIVSICLRCHYGKLVGIPCQVGVANDVFALIMVAEDDDAVSEFFAGFFDA